MNDTCARCDQPLPMFGMRRCYGKPKGPKDTGNLCYRAVVKEDA